MSETAVRRQPQIMGIFQYIEDVVDAIEALGRTKSRILDVFSPAPNDDIERALGEQRNIIRFIPLLGGIVGGLCGFALCLYSFLQWRLVVWGKPFIAWLPYTLVGYEFTILGAVIWMFFGVLIVSRSRPRRNVPSPYDPRFTVDHFGILITCAPGEREAAIGSLKAAGAKEIHEYE